MTATSTRRAAEIAIIDAAYELVDAPLYSDMNARIDRLRGRVREHEDLGLDTTSQPAFSNNSTDTSAEAGASMVTHVGKLARQCFDEIASVYRNDGVGMTVDALEQVLNRSHQSVSARVNELRNKGWLTDSGVRRKTRSGRAAIVWTVSEQAKAAKL
jgi:hypothetical protein